MKMKEIGQGDGDVPSTPWYDDSLSTSTCRNNIGFTRFIQTCFKRKHG